MSNKHLVILSAFLGGLIVCLFAAPCLAEGQDASAVIAQVPAPTSPAVVSGTTSATITQATEAAAGQLPIELTPVRLPERRSAGEAIDAIKTGFLYKLPARMFFNATVENSLRLETNVYQTAHHQRADMVYRILPNVTLGYNLTRRTSVAANYFFLRDQYTRNAHILSRNIQSAGIRLDHDIPINQRTNARVGLFWRELFVTHFHWFNDMIPTASISRVVGYRGWVYATVMGQLRWIDWYKTFQEGDQFYSIGGVYRRGGWTFLHDTTLVTNFGKRQLRLGPNNQQFILTFEAAHPIVRHVPVVAFVRAQPIFNIGANEALGFAGYNFRIFGGLRAELNKPAIFPIKLRT